MCFTPTLTYILCSRHSYDETYDERFKYGSDPRLVLGTTYFGPRNRQTSISLLLIGMSPDVADAIDASSLDVLVPAESTLDIEKFLGPSAYENGRPTGQPLLSTIPQRDMLYFGRSPAHTLPDSILLLIPGNE